jgi:hypothetical protein
MRRILAVATNQATYGTDPHRTGLWIGELVHFHAGVRQAGFEVAPQGRASSGSSASAVAGCPAGRVRPPAGRNRDRPRAGAEVPLGRPLGSRHVVPRASARRWRGPRPCSQGIHHGNHRPTCRTGGRSCPASRSRRASCGSSRMRAGRRPAACPSTPLPTGFPRAASGAADLIAGVPIWVTA